VEQERRTARAHTAAANCFIREVFIGFVMWMALLLDLGWTSVRCRLPAVNVWPE
jgi:hypothetical protein